MKSSLPGYNFNDLSGNPINQLGQFEDILLEAENKGVVTTPPESEAQTYDVYSQKIRLKTIASRLYLLGYLPRKISAGNIDKRTDDIARAVLQFQKEANLKPDKWAGEKTWNALDQLVSFESELKKEQWFKEDIIRPEVRDVVHRAIQLRLWSLGLFFRQPNKRFRLLSRKGLRAFNNVLKIFLIRHADFVADFNYETISLLFDQDVLTNAIIKRSSIKRNSFMLHTSGDENLINLARRYIVNCAKIELWLLGYQVKIDGRNDFDLPKGNNLSKIIARYFQDFEDFTSNVAHKAAQQITPKLFIGITESNKIDDSNSTHDDVSEVVAEQLKTGEEIENAWSYIKDRGMRLWDGLKRIWRWIKRIGKKVVSFIKENIFKGFFRFVTKSFQILKKGIKVLAHSVGTFIKGEIKSPQLLVKFSKDMDSTILFSSTISRENAIKGMNKIENQSKAFNVSCRIISWVFRIFKSIVTGFMGWAKLLYSLLSGFKELKLLYLDLKEVAI